jgi:hypothetical protein
MRKSLSILLIVVILGMALITVPTQRVNAQAEVEPGFYTLEVNNTATSVIVTQNGAMQVYFNSSADKVEDVEFQIPADIPFTLYAFPYDGVDLGEVVGSVQSELIEETSLGSSSFAQQVISDVAANTLVAVKFSEGQALRDVSLPQTTTCNVGDTARVINAVNQRSGPGMQYGRVGNSLPVGFTFTVEETQYGWLRHGTLWSHSNYVTCYTAGTSVPNAPQAAAQTEIQVTNVPGPQAIELGVLSGAIFVPANTDVNIGVWCSEDAPQGYQPEVQMRLAGNQTGVTYTLLPHCQGAAWSYSYSAGWNYDLIIADITAAAGRRGTAVGTGAVWGNYFYNN